MNLYHAIFIIRYNFIDNEYDMNAFLKNLSDITGNNIEIVRSEYWGLLNFSYLINKKKKGHYISVFIKSDFNNIKILDRKVKLLNDIVRFSLFKIKKLPTHESEMLKNHKKLLDDSK